MKYSVRLTIDQMKLILNKLPDDKEGKKIRKSIEKKMTTLNA